MRTTINAGSGPPCIEDASSASERTEKTAIPTAVRGERSSVARTSAPTAFRNDVRLPLLWRSDASGCRDRVTGFNRALILARTFLREWRIDNLILAGPRPWKQRLRAGARGARSSSRGTL